MGGAKEKRLVELVALELEALEQLFLELGSSRRRRTGAATVAKRSLRKQIPSIQSPGRRGLTADGQIIGLLLFSFATCPQSRQLWR
eukprot:5364525-Pleurochrysis_carterae.AAC.1